MRSPRIGDGISLVLLVSEITLESYDQRDPIAVFENDGVTVEAQSLKLGLSTVVSGFRPWNERARGVILRGRHVRSTFQRSVRPAIHVPSRGSLRSSSTGEPSDPPFGAMYSEFYQRFPVGFASLVRQSVKLETR